MTGVLRLVIAGAVIVLLGRAARAAWRNRRVAVAVWQRIRLRHVAGSVMLLTLVLVVAVTLSDLVPVTNFGLGSLVGLHGNAIFAPIEEIADRAPGVSPGAAGEPSADGAPRPDDSFAWVGRAAVGAFLLLLLALFPWLAYVEEHAFRAGLERAGPVRQILSALRFGLVHLVMLIPLFAALAVAVAGFVYGLIYRAAFRRAERRQLAVAGPFPNTAGVAVSQRQARAEALLASTVWHTTFNSLIALLVLVGYLLAGL